MPSVTRSRNELARIALREALETRREAKVAWTVPICIYDFVESIGTEVWFVAGSSFAGMYAKGFGRLFVPAERPAGRRAFTCAHEMAHMRFGHGSRVEELDFDRVDSAIPEEQLANHYAAFLMMPRHAVADAINRRKLDPETASPINIYAVANQFGVGYETLVNHLRWSLNLVSHPRMEALLQFSPKVLRSEVLGIETQSQLVLADEYWHSVAIDLEVGDYAVVPRKVSFRGTSVRSVGECAHGSIIEGVRPGLTQALGSGTGWAAMVRVSRKQFAGRCAYRHLEDDDENP